MHRQLRWFSNLLLRFKRRVNELIWRHLNTNRSQVFFSSYFSSKQSKAKTEYLRRFTISFKEKLKKWEYTLFRQLSSIFRVDRRKSFDLQASGPTCVLIDSLSWLPMNIELIMTSFHKNIRLSSSPVSSHTKILIEEIFLSAQRAITDSEKCPKFNRRKKSFWWWISCFSKCFSLSRSVLNFWWVFDGKLLSHVENWRWEVWKLWGTKFTMKMLCLLWSVSTI